MSADSARVTADVAAAEKDLERLRGHLSALGGSGSEAGALVRRILLGEDKLTMLHEKLKALAGETAGHFEAVRTELGKLAPGP